MHVRTCGKPLCGGGAPPPPATQQPSPATRRAGGSFSAHSVSHALPACLDGSAGAPHCASSSTTAPSVPPPATSTLPRRALGFQLLAAAAGALSAPQHALAATAEEIETLQAAAFAAYAERDFATAESALGQIIEAQPGDAKWLEMRAQAFVDGKDFDKAVKDFEQALVLMADGDLPTRARLHAGRALAYEGLSRWQDALGDYNAAMMLAAAGGESADPYVLNSRGNCYNSLGRWEEARADYLASAELFQAARGFRGSRGGTQNPRLDGAIFASSNAALMRAQLGDEPGAIAEMERVARRAPGSADMRAALAALYWAAGRSADAEGEWEFACNSISVGCSKYQDADWLRRIRRWPPAMVDKLQAFIQLR